MIKGLSDRVKVKGLQAVTGKSWFSRSHGMRERGEWEKGTSGSKLLDM